ncbi:AAA family ATPase [Corynebacterium lizhenjunii]|uniref:AAA family ATPase n=1 Tax=Corynebacterium lizhenjunii TaxID=2709394 RepID=A0A7T0KGE8_9CORY|nr:AAA family ATPase [Corynebacterium lizhenjunii]QPK80114.1 AAA family ATPase [Corynebacterium lizhenjunii]
MTSHPRPVSSARTAEIAAEQDYVTGLFDRLDAEVAAANARLAKVEADVDPANPDSDALVRRETEYHGLQAKLDKLHVAQLGLVFGRIDIDAPGDNPTPEGLDRRYIGRMGLDDRADDYRTLLLDWRAPMARPFYLATTASPEGVALRRHIRTRGRTVTDIHDEILTHYGHPSESSAAASSATAAADAVATESAVATEDAGVAGESALHAALQRARTGHMSSIVETIQREQDEIIRDSTRGVMVVEGGPGTGKTAVALHRVAYLLYHHREMLAATGVLIVGPNTTFLNYISHVLPELGETGVVLSTIGELFPGVSPVSTDSLLAQEIKGSEAMVDILGNAVKLYQRLPETDREVRVDSIRLQVSPAMVKAARTRARRSRKPHNIARGAFAEQLQEQLAQQLAQRIGADPLGGANLLSRADIDQLHDDLADNQDVQDLIEEMWPHLHPTQVLADLLGSQETIAAAAHEYDEETQQALYREHPTAWSAADAALLDELAVLVGLPDPEQAQATAEQQWREQLADAAEALDILASSEATDNDDDMFEAEILSAADVIDAEHLARRQEVRDARTTAQRAQADHTWAYGHVIIDEAQELTPMEWRMVFRRSPSRWMTLVGDTAQTGAPAGVDSWEETLEPFVGARFRHHQLTVNYRTPEPVTELANRVLAVIDPLAVPAVAVREGIAVNYVPLDESSRPHPRVFTDEDGRLNAIIDASTVVEAKGLEYDHVTVVAPAEIVAASPQGLNNLYVAITRATQTLTIVGPLDI